MVCSSLRRTSPCLKHVQRSQPSRNADPPQRCAPFAAWKKGKKGSTTNKKILTKENTSCCHQRQAFECPSKPEHSWESHKSKTKNSTYFLSFCFFFPSTYHFSERPCRTRQQKSERLCTVLGQKHTSIIDFETLSQHPFQNLNELVQTNENHRLFAVNKP